MVQLRPNLESLIRHEKTHPLNSSRNRSPRLRESHDTERDRSTSAKAGDSAQYADLYTGGLNFREVASYYNIEGSKNGSDYQLTLTPKTAAVRKLLQSVDLTIDEKLTPVRVIIHDSKGQIFTETYTNVRRDTLPASTFEFAAPPGTKVSTPLGN